VKLRTAIRLLPTMANVKLFGSRTPLIVSVVLTSRCNFHCHYCGCWRKNDSEIGHDRLLELFGEMAAAGTRKVIFTGGEPLLREDFAELVRAVKSHGMMVAVNTNGSLVEQNLAALKDCDGVSLSLDGPETVHDAIRGSNSFKTLRNAAAALNQHGIQLRFAIVVSRLNLDCLDDLLAICRAHRASLSIQPASQTLLFAEEANPYRPTPAAFQTFVNRLLAAKRRQAPVSNSTAGLKYLRAWPTNRPLRCSGGKIFCRVEANGGVTICGRGAGKTEAGNIHSASFIDCFRQIQTPDCNACWCGLLAELNLSYALHPGTIRNTLLYF
jgi:MoaA/NifB/PqqE/SkfB family radical SAM enzyme